MGVCLVHEKAGNRLYMFNHVEYDSTSLSDEYFRDVHAGVPIKLPHDYFPHNDPELAPLNRWRSHATCFSGTGSTKYTRRRPTISTLSDRWPPELRDCELPENDATSARQFATPGRMTR